MPRTLVFEARRYCLFATTLLLTGLLAGFAQAAEQIGRVVIASGMVEAVDAAGTRRALERRAPVFEGDTLITGPAGRAQIRFVDQARLAMRPDTEIVIAEYRNNVGSESSDLELRRGGLRTITGRIADRSRAAYRVRTPLVTIGVRGTDFEATQRPGAEGYLGVGQGDIDATSATGETASLGDSANFRYAQVNTDGSFMLLPEAPTDLAITPPITTDDEGGDEGGDDQGGDGEGQGGRPGQQQSDDQGQSEGDSEGDGQGDANPQGEGDGQSQGDNQQADGQPQQQQQQQQGGQGSRAAVADADSTPPPPPPQPEAQVNQQTTAQVEAPQLDTSQVNPNTQGDGGEEFLEARGGPSDAELARLSNNGNVSVLANVPAFSSDGTPTGTNRAVLGVTATADENNAFVAATDIAANGPPSGFAGATNANRLTGLNLRIDNGASEPAQLVSDAAGISGVTLGILQANADAPLLSLIPDGQNGIGVSISDPVPFGFGPELADLTGTFLFQSTPGSAVGVSNLGTFAGASMGFLGTVDTGTGTIESGAISATILEADNVLSSFSGGFSGSLANGILTTEFTSVFLVRTDGSGGVSSGGGPIGGDADNPDSDTTTGVSTSFEATGQLTGSLVGTSETPGALASFQFTETGTDHPGTSDSVTLAGTIALIGTNPEPPPPPALSPEEILSVQQSNQIALIANAPDLIVNTSGDAPFTVSNAKPGAGIGLGGISATEGFVGAFNALGEIDASFATATRAQRFGAATAFVGRGTSPSSFQIFENLGGTILGRFSPDSANPFRVDLNFSNDSGFEGISPVGQVLGTAPLLFARGPELADLTATGTLVLTAFEAETNFNSVVGIESDFDFSLNLGTGTIDGILDVLLGTPSETPGGSPTVLAEFVTDFDGQVANGIILPNITRLTLEDRTSPSQNEVAATGEIFGSFVGTSASPGALLSFFFEEETAGGFVPDTQVFATGVLALIPGQPPEEQSLLSDTELSRLQTGNELGVFAGAQLIGVNTQLQDPFAANPQTILTLGLAAASDSGSGLVGAFDAFQNFGGIPGTFLTDDTNARFNNAFLRFDSDTLSAALDLNALPSEFSGLRLGQINATPTNPFAVEVNVSGRTDIDNADDIDLTQLTYTQPFVFGTGPQLSNLTANAVYDKVAFRAITNFGSVTNVESNMTFNINLGSGTISDGILDVFMTNTDNSLATFVTDFIGQINNGVISTNVTDITIVQGHDTESNSVPTFGATGEVNGFFTNTAQDPAAFLGFRFEETGTDGTGSFLSNGDRVFADGVVLLRPQAVPDVNSSNRFFIGTTCCFNPNDPDPETPEIVFGRAQDPETTTNPQVGFNVFFDANSASFQDVPPNDSSFFDTPVNTIATNNEPTAVFNVNPNGLDDTAIIEWHGFPNNPITTTGPEGTDLPFNGNFLFNTFKPTSFAGTTQNLIFTTKGNNSPRQGFRLNQTNNSPTDAFSLSFIYSPSSQQISSGSLVAFSSTGGTDSISTVISGQTFGAIYNTGQTDSNGNQINGNYEVAGILPFAGGVPRGRFGFSRTLREESEVFVNFGTAGATTPIANVAYNLVANDANGGVEQSLGTAILQTAQELRVPNGDLPSFTKLGFVVFNPLNTTGGLEGAIPHQGVHPGLHIGLSDGATSPRLMTNLFNSSTTLNVFELPADLVFQQNNSTLFGQVTDVAASAGLSPLTGFRVDWGIWNATPSTPAVALTDNNNASIQTAIGRDVFFATVEDATSPGQLAQLSGTLNFGGNFFNGSTSTIGVLGRGGSIATPNVTAAVDTLDVSVVLDLATGGASGSLNLSYINPDPTVSSVSMQSTLLGALVGGSIVFNVDSLTVSSLSGSGGGDLANSSVRALILGSSAEQLLGAFSLSGQSQTAQGFFLAPKTN